MEKEQDYLKDIAEIRSMMERSSKFLSLSGWSGILAGIYALVGVYLVHYQMGFNPIKLVYGQSEIGNLTEIIFMGIGVLVLALGTAIVLSAKKSNSKGEQIWNASSRHLLENISVPLLTGGILILISFSVSLVGLVLPFTLIFYGIALYNGSRVTYDSIKYLGVLQIVLGLISIYYIEFSLLLWAIGFGALHVIYGAYIYLKHER